MKKLVLIGGGGHASNVLGVVEEIGAGIELLGFVDDGHVDARRFENRDAPHLGPLAELPRLGATHYVSAVGWPETRRVLARHGDAAGLEPLVLVSPKANVGSGVTIGPGSVVFAGACVAPMAVVGEHCYIGQLASVEHDCVIGDFTSVMPAAVLSGDSKIGARCTVGTNATVIQGRTLSDDVILGAGAVAVRDLSGPGTYVGVPARHLT